MSCAGRQAISLAVFFVRGTVYSCWAAPLAQWLSSGSYGPLHECCCRKPSGCLDGSDPRCGQIDHAEGFVAASLWPRASGSTACCSMGKKSGFVARVFDMWLLGGSPAYESRALRLAASGHKVRLAVGSGEWDVRRQLLEGGGCRYPLRRQPACARRLAAYTGFFRGRSVRRAVAAATDKAVGKC